MTYLPATALVTLLTAGSGLAADACVDLSGQWVGACFDNDHGPPRNHTVEIVQSGCSVIVINGQTRHIPSTFTIPAGDTGRTETHTLQWAADGKTLFDTQSFRLNLGEGAGFMDGTVASRLSRDGQSLVTADEMNAVLHDWQGQTSDVTGHTSCSYSRR